jgi:acetoin utilization deacetylase AcuC-like enzyme
VWYESPMALNLPVLWSDSHAGHRPGGEVWVGVRTPGTEVPARAERIRDAVAAAGAPLVGAERQPDDTALALHDPALVAYLREAWPEWAASGLVEDPGADRVVPYLFAHAGMLGGLPWREPTAPAARAGAFAYDTMTLIGPGTWEAARSALDVAIGAADAVLSGAPAAYALCRPPGHHATREAFGGSCYLNNAGAAAAQLTADLGPVAVLDVDAHHGNGTQAIFYERDDVLTGSVHVDPAAGWFPHFVGFADERGAGAGAGANLNLPLAPDSGDDAWLEAVARLAAWARESGARALVIALGVDAARADPESPLAVSADGFRTGGRELGALGLPTVVVQEGGYDLDAIGELVVTALRGVEEGLQD